MAFAIDLLGGSRIRKINNKAQLITANKLGFEWFSFAQNNNNNSRNNLS